MKRCPKCGQIYSESDVNFCLNDGELLSRDVGPAREPTDNDDSPPTLLMDPRRVTDQTNWRPTQPPVLYQSPAMNAADRGFGLVDRDRPSSPDQTLATVALGLGIGSIVLSVCCYGGVWLGLPAAVVGFLAMRNIQSDPERYGGRGLAIGGMVTGIISLMISILLFIIVVLA